MNATLYQSDEVLVERIASDDLSRYVLTLSAAMSRALASANRPEMLDVVVIARPAADCEPDDRVRFWLLSDLEDPAEHNDREGLAEELAAVPTPELTGPIAFALTFSMAGALPPSEHEPRAPQEWQLAAATGPGGRGGRADTDAGSTTAVIPDDLIPSIWGEPSGST